MTSPGLCGTPRRGWTGAWTLALLIAGAALSGCASKPDTRYLESRQLAPLAIPAGLDTPAYTQTMEIPKPNPRADRGDDAEADLELPPRRIAAP